MDEKRNRSCTIKNRAASLFKGLPLFSYSFAMKENKEMHNYILETQRLILRPLTVADSDAVFQWVGDERVAMCLVGSGSIGPDADRNDYWGFGYNFRQDCWGNGYATEAVKAMMKFAYEYFGITRFSSSHAEPNKASGHVMEKCGLHFVKYGQFQKLDGSCKMRSMEYENENLIEI